MVSQENKGWAITQVLNTHEHGDHTGGNQKVIAAAGAKLLAHENAKQQIAGMDIGLKAGDVVKVGVELLAPDTPGHTMSQRDNLEFTLAREPDNDKAKDLLAEMNQWAVNNNGRDSPRAGKWNLTPILGSSWRSACL